jgi:hypothetical protein
MKTNLIKSYSCEPAVRKYFQLCRVQSESATENLIDGLRQALTEHVPTPTPLEWLIVEQVPRARVVAAHYDRLTQSRRIADQFVQQKLTWNKATLKAGNIGRIRVSDQIQIFNLISKLAKLVVRSKLGEDRLIDALQKEIEQARGARAEMSPVGIK